MELNGINRINELYYNYLNKIDNYSFTNREIDVFSCIINNRSDKKIASILSISPRTVSSHIYNLMNKIGCNSKDSLIDYAEKKGLVIVLREYYNHLLVKKEFNKILSEIAKDYKDKKIIIYFDIDKSLNMNSLLLKQIQSDINIINIELISTPKISEETRFLELEKITINNYYFDFLESLNNLIEDPEFNEKYIYKFLEEFEKIKKLLDKEVTYSSKEKVTYSKNTSLYVLFAIFMMVFVFFVGSKLLSSNQSKSNKNNRVLNAQVIIDSLKKYDLSPNNIDKVMSQKNISIIRKIEDIIQLDIDMKIKVFEDPSLTTENLAEFIYYIHAISSYYCFHEKNNLNKAKAILFYAKDLIEKYVKNRNLCDINFDSLEPEEILSELEFFKDIPELYTSVLYMIGRIYIYTKEHNKSIFYFERSYKLAKKLNLFEAPLSLRSGVALAKTIEIKEILKTRKIDNISEKLKEIILIHQDLQFDNNSYILNFRPNSSNKNKIVPAKNLHHIIECGYRIIDLYQLIIEFETNNNIDEYIKIIDYQLFGDDNFEGIVIKSKSISSQKLAQYYIILGNLFFSINHKYSDKNLIKKFNSYFKINLTNYLQLSEYFFSEAKNLSKLSNVTKSESLEGLIKLYKKELENINLTILERKLLEEKLNNTIKKMEDLKN